MEAGVNEVGLSDTTGMANPAQVRRLFKQLRAEIGERTGAAHLHNTRGLGLANFNQSSLLRVGFGATEGAGDLSAPPLVQISSFAMLVKNRVRSQGMVRMGGAALLTGTGMAFPWPLFADAPLPLSEVFGVVRDILDVQAQAADTGEHRPAAPPAAPGRKTSTPSTRPGRARPLRHAHRHGRGGLRRAGAAVTGLLRTSSGAPGSRSRLPIPSLPAG